MKFLIPLSFGIPSVIVAVVVLPLLGYDGTNTTDRESFLCWTIFLGTGVTGMILAFSVWQYGELRRLRAMKKFLWNWWASGGHLQPIVNAALTQKAGAVRFHSEKLIRLQQDGLRAGENPNCDATDEEGLGRTFDNVKFRLTWRFQESQTEFYRIYDQIRLFADILRIKLKGRSWKAYIGESEVAAK